MQVEIWHKAKGKVKKDYKLATAYLDIPVYLNWGEQVEELALKLYDNDDAKAGKVTLTGKFTPNGMLYCR